MSFVARVVSVFRSIAIVIAIGAVFLFGVATTVYLSLRSPEVQVPDVVGKDRFEAERILALDSAIERLASLNPRQARIIECRFFAGLSEEETAAALGVSLRTAQRDWMKARAWLQEELRS